MRKSLFVVFLMLVITPLGVISWLSYSNIAREQSMSVERYSILAKGRLEEIDRLLQSHLRRLETELRAYQNVHALGTDELRRIGRRTRVVDQLFVIDEENRFLFPPESGELSEKEEEFLKTAGELELPLLLGNRSAETAPGDTGERGWYTWFEGEGVSFLYWQTADNGYRTGVVIDRIAFISGIIAVLPDSELTNADDYSGRVVMTDARGKVLYQWGLYTPADDEAPVAVTALSQPLASWRLESYFDLERELPFLSRYGSLLPGVAAAVIVLVLLSVYFYRENKKVVEDALQKVSFVNQVSHELRTPLTNIRLYTELLKERTSDAEDKRRLEIVLSESRRLSRMIANVLTFARSEKKRLETSPGEIVVDDIIRGVADSFAVSLESKSIRVKLSCNAPVPIITDRDFVEQILSNLIANAEKYAAVGKYLEISSSQGARSTTIHVEDRGPGIPARERKRIFEPFYRISNKLTDGVSGAGIGLAVSKMLAEKIGGTLTLEKVSSGAVFTVEIPNNPAGEAK